MPRALSASLLTLALCTPLCASPSLAPAFQESAELLIRQGRELFDAGRASEAQLAFERAAALSPTPAARFWVVRGLIALGRFDEAMIEADELRGQGLDTAETDYLLGLAFLGAAKQAIAAGSATAFTQDQLADAYRLLSSATAADAARFPDAWLPLAEAGWYAQELEGARAAADRAIALRPADSAAHGLRGKIAFSQFSALESGGDSPLKEEHWTTARESFRRAIELLGAPTDAAARSTLAEAHLQCGHLASWKADKAGAAGEYAQAMEWDPTRVDFAQVRASLGAAFKDCVTDGAQRFRARYGADQPVYATLAWWDGYARFEAGDWEGSESAFTTALALWPAYTNSWFYLFRLNYSQGEYAEAIAALESYAQADATGLVAMLSGSAADQVRVIDYLVGWCANPDEHQGRALNVQAALLCEILTRVQPEESRHWNNLGLFVRDQGDALRWARGGDGGSAADPVELARLWERSSAAYARALELDPQNANYVNDYAVMLHYYLCRDLDQAQELYVRSQALAEAALGREDLPEAERAVIRIALRDSQDNQRRLALYREKLAAGETVDPDSIR